MKLSIFKKFIFTIVLFGVYQSASLANTEDALILEPLNCSKEQTLKSQTGDSPAVITFINSTDETVIVQWINYEGKRDKQKNQIRSLKPGETHGVSTFFTHPFIIFDLSGRCLGIYMAQALNNLVLIK